MTRGMLGRVAVLCATVWSIGSIAQAQLAPRGRPRYGMVNLRTGFTPDPQIMSGVMGGSVPASQLGGNCRGSVYPQPSHVVRTRTGFQRIRFVVNGQGDATLMVMLPNGQVLCDDDGGEGLNPLIETSSPPGAIRVWVGVYSDSNQGRPYTIGVTELSHITANNLPVGRVPGPGPGLPPPPQVSGAQPNSPPAFGVVSLRTGFMPDPQVVAGSAGGPVEASQIDPSCRGWVTPQPGHVLMSQTGFRNLRLVVNSGSLDTTLVVMLPNGQIICNDDGGSSMNPLLSVSSPPGPIRIWVGTYSSGRTGAYNIGFSEIASVATESIPPPGGGVVVNPGYPQRPPPIVQPQVQADVVDMQVSIPVTLLGPGLGATLAVWHPNGGPSTQVAMNGLTLVAGGVTLATLPPTMQDPVVTVTQQRNGNLIVRAEQPPMGRRDRGATMILLVGWAGQPVIQDRWSGRFGQRGPRWAR